MNHSTTGALSKLRSMTNVQNLLRPGELMRNVGAFVGVKQTYRAPILFFLSRQHRLAYLQMPKVACTSIRTAICLLNRPDLAPQHAAGTLEIHSHPEWNDKVGENSPEIAGFFRFTFVRNPYARFVSFYQNKIVGKDNQGPVRRFLKLGYTSGMSIDDVLDMVERTPVLELDPHLLPQSEYLLRGGRLHVDFIGRIERFAQDMTVVETWAGTKLDVGQLNATRGPKTKEERPQLTDEQKRRIARLYAKDFELLGYDI